MYNFDDLIERENTNCYKYDLREKFFKTNKVMPLWVADMDFKTPNFIIEGIKKRLEHEVLGYSFFGESAIQAVQNWMQRRHGWTVDKQWISFTPGVVPALNISVLSFTQAGDKIIIQPPVYFPFYTAVKDHGRKVLENPLVLNKQGRYQINYEQLEELAAAPETKLMLLCNPHNPTGNVWTKDELAKVADICTKHNVVIISDEIHSDIIFKGHTHQPMATVSETAASGTITCMAPSKTFNMAGMATSVVITSNPDLMKQFSSELNKYHIGSGNVLGHYALEAAYNHGDGWLQEMLDYLQDNIHYLTSFINENIPEIKVIAPEATYLVWLDCRALGLNDSELYDFMIKKARLGLSHGPIFGEGGSGFQRINIGCPKSYLTKALNNLHNALKVEKIITSE